MIDGINEFNAAEDTKQFKTEWNWCIVLGQVEQMSSTKGLIHTSHPHLLVSPKTDIQFYQKMCISFAGQGAKSKKKCEAVIYCQKIVDKELTLHLLWTQFREAGWFNFTFIYYLFFASLMAVFFAGGRMCKDVYEPTPDQELEVIRGDERDWTARQQFC